MADADFPPRPPCYTVVVHRSDGGYSRESVDGPRRRLETYGRDGRLLFAAIYRHDLGLCWSLHPLAGRWTESPFAQMKASPLAQSLGSMVRWAAAGPVESGGVACLQYVGTYQMQDVGSAREECLIESATGLPLRHATYNKLGQEAVVWTRTSLDLTPPDPSLFEAPGGSR
jgi:hypothetical protein